MRPTKRLKATAITLLVIEMLQIAYPELSYALTSGPSQPEMQQFTPIGTSDMVDLFTGDFSYNIPLIDVEGYPINLAYASGINMDQEASWVGLGWNINPGEINRELRGVPDDANGDTVIQKENTRKNITVGVQAQLDGEAIGFDLANNGVTVDIFYNNYKKFGLSYGVSFIGNSGGDKTGFLGQLSVESGNQSGLDITGKVGITGIENHKAHSAISIGAGINSREGLQQVTLDAFSKKPAMNSTKKSSDAFAGSASTSYSFGETSFFPSSDIPHNSFSFAFNVKLGGDIVGFFANSEIGGYYSSQSITDTINTMRSYGLMFNDNAMVDKGAVMDVDREKDIPVSKNSVNLAVPFSTFDIFNVSGHDVGGSYHISRNDLGVYSDRPSSVTGLSASGGIDLGGGALAKFGANIKVTLPHTTVSRWDELNYFEGYSPFTSLAGDNLYEPYYFKNSGEMPVDTNKILEQTGGTSPATTFIGSFIDDQSIALPVFMKQSIDGTNTPIPVTEIITRPERAARQQSMSFLNSTDASYFGLEKNILSYPKNTVNYACDSPLNIDTIVRTTRKAEHISEITITKGDGSRYIYGVPVYNNYQEDATFNIDTSGVDTISRQVLFNATDNSTSNAEGKDHYYSSKITPAYAHSFLLSGVLSPDYVDNTGDGITEDDKGNAYRFNYTKIYDNYHWRTPFGLDSASYQEGLKTVANDDMGSYSYGTKEIWYVHSIESRNLVAQFIISKRTDGHGVLNKYGGINLADSLMKLDRIDLYSKSDLIKYGENAIPIKSVHFTYDYSLCKGVPNQENTDNGKLTLKSIYFTYGKSEKGKLNVYRFNYDDAGNEYSNPDYDPNGHDRWGNFSNHDVAFSDLLVSDYPYVIQDKTLANKFAGAWELKSIDLPSGGTINITYESDDYAYVQNKKACNMYEVAGFGSDSDGTYNNQLFDILHDNNYIFINLPKYVHSRSEFKELYLSEIDTLYYKCLVDVNNDKGKEYITGYADWNDYGVRLDGADSTSIGWLKLSQTQDGLFNYQPIAYASWQFLRLKLPAKAYPGSDLSDGATFMDYVWSVLSIIPNLYDRIVGFNNVAKQEGKGRFTSLSNSFVRLENPYLIKYGGGQRVSSITLNDNWHKMLSTDHSFEYGQEYQYTKQFKDTTGKLHEVSSGVAAYEPIIGNEENPFRVPVGYKQGKFLGPDDFYYAEEPFGEALYPSPVVGYSEVKVQNLQYDDVIRTATGYTVSDFYTAYDFPVYSHRTDLNAIRVKPNPILKVLNISVKDYYTGSQGFAIELNDMHGKQKSESVFNELGTMISSKNYYYKVDNVNALEKHLANDCQVVLPDGSITTKTIGVDFEAYQDMRQEETDINGGGFNFNTDVIFLFLGVIPLPSSYPTISNSQTRFRSSATTKLVKRYGILDSVVVNENGSSITTENLLYDSESGTPLLTKVTNEFGDPVYNFTYPAHWIYSTMGPAYRNLGGVFRDVEIVNGVLTPSGIRQYFIPGDEVAVFSDDFGGKEKIYAAKPSGSLVFLDEDGDLYSSYEPDGTTPSKLNLQILRSGNRNESQISAGSVSTMVNPINNATHKIDISSTSKVLSAEGIVYSEQWRSTANELNSDCQRRDPPEANCLKSFLSYLYSIDDETAPKKAGLMVDELVDSLTACSSDTSISLGHVPFYNISGVDHTSLFKNDLGVIAGYPIDAIVPIPSFMNTESKMGKCSLFFINTIDQYLPVGNFYRFVTPLDAAEYPDGAVSVIYNGPEPVTGSIDQDTVGYYYVQCLDCQTNCKELTEGDSVNPYTTNMLGVWHPFKTYTYNEERTPAINVKATHLESDGVFKNYEPFYDFNTGTHSWDIDSADNNWIWATESTIFDRHGNEVENNNALDIKSSAIYGYNGSLPIAVINNAKLKQVANDNFEDYGFKVSCSDICDIEHWDFSNLLDANVKLTDSTAHSGNYSLLVNPGHSVEVEKDISYPSGDILYASGSKYHAGGDAKIPDFSPDSTDYLFSAWIKVDTACQCRTYSEPYVHVSFDGVGTTYNLKSAGPIIEGWQRVESKFHIPDGATSIKVKLYADSGESTFFDDIRIHPYKANMKTFVYDERTLRLMAQLDENNYATYYEYDEEGNLIRVKRETERGIVTIQEGRSRFKPN